jgi:Family of unknown function (DUF5343)
MPIPSAYLTSSKNLDGILTAMQQAKAPERFTQRFLETLGYQSNSDRLAIGVLKAIGFLDDQGKPTDIYFQFLDQTQSKRVLGEAIQEAYADLFEVNTSAHRMDRGEVKNKLKTLSQGQYGESVIDKMAMTFAALANLADFSKSPNPAMKARSSLPKEEVLSPPVDEAPDLEMPQKPNDKPRSISWGGLHYNIQLILPESRDPKVYDALFRSLREHL